MRYVVGQVNVSPCYSLQLPDSGWAVGNTKLIFPVQLLPWVASLVISCYDCQCYAVVAADPDEICQVS